MGGEWVVKKPSRSDEVMEADRQLRIAEEVRAHFDNMAPKRPMKPNRSESDSTTETPLQGSCFENGTIPELNKLQSLRSQSEPFFSDGAFLVQDEFVETQYYKELNSIDKQHHMTGSGFIRVASEGSGEVYRVQSEGMSDGGARDMGLMVFRSNPATNDWIPSVEGEQALFTSSKPNRSESC